MYKKIFSLGLAVAISTSLLAQFTIPLKGNVLCIEADNFDNLYIADESGSINKYNVKGEMIGSFDISNFMGNVTMDVTNPLQMVVYNSESRIGVLLDQSLNIISEFPMENISMLTSSVEGEGFFVVDNTHNTVKHVNNRGVVIKESAEIVGTRIEKIMASEKYIYLFGNSKLFVGNTELQYFEEKNIYGLTDLQYVKKQIVGKLNGVFYKYDIDTNDMRSLHLAQETEVIEGATLRLAGNFAILCTETGLRVSLREK